jgi:hypothetical protein
VPAAASRTLSLAAATIRDLLRRPGAWLALAGFAVLLLVVPRLARRALDDGAALGTELVLSTVWLYASVFGGLAGARAAEPSASLGPTAEVLVTPLGRSEYVLGRAGGVAAATLAHALALLAVGTLGLLLAGGAPPLGPSLAGAILAGMVHIALFTAAGLAAGALLGGQLAAVIVVALLVAARLLLPGLTEIGAAWTWWVPDPARLELSREVAFARPLGAPAMLASLGAGALQTLALLAVARIGLAAGGRADRAAQR